MLRTLGDHENIRISKSSNYKDSNHSGFLFGDFFKGPENFVQIREFSSDTISH